MRALPVVVLLLLSPVGLRGQSVAPDAEPLRLRPGDAVRLQVGGEPGFACGPVTGFEEPMLPGVTPRRACEFDVDEEGDVLLPLVGAFRVAGEPFPTVRERIRAAFAAELKEPAVSVTPLLRIAVLGEVRRPGLLRVDPTYDLAEVLAEAGGLTPDAARDGVTLLRDGAELRIALDGAGLGTPLRVLPGDQVVVGRRGWFSRNASAVLGVAGSVLAAVVTSLILR